MSGSSPRYIAVYPGSFDPITLGHTEILERAAQLFDEVVVAVGHHPVKRGFFSYEQRVELIREVTAHIPNVRAAHFSGLMIDFCREVGARVIVRGLRAAGDFEPEFQMALANRELEPKVETVFLIPEPQKQFISSSLIREIASHGGPFQRFVPGAVSRAMEARYPQHYGGPAASTDD
ncbi:phosphopantetheine adenylyltransferase [Plesiocystis pacifica SIR-1]|uniref:Phosphopantetheine adenylyltransferase n=1 Tax=Plesiocystis pacifica SIR-1 TaxID=391625 RepID=A6G8D2_9BACT|nr:pantetheine-phosphate adenylyltransferase [Plesiocystis pacifica]EDM77842.1 phosphopantetheine adenylyltransferase [Plesiocystis pacifica SIR-1]